MNIKHLIALKSPASKHQLAGAIVKPENQYVVEVNADLKPDVQLAEAQKNLTTLIYGSATSSAVQAVSSAYAFLPAEFIKLPADETTAAKS